MSKKNKHKSKAVSESKSKDLTIDSIIEETRYLTEQEERESTRAITNKRENIFFEYDFILMPPWTLLILL